MNVGIGLSSHYLIECFDKDGVLKWKEEFDNLVTTVGRNKVLDATFKTGLATPLWYIGLKGTGTLTTAHTMSSHAAWSELTSYTGNRPAFTPGTIASASVNNSAAVAAFAITGTMSVFGCFMVDDNTKGGTTGVLYGGGDFTASRSVVNTDTLNITISLTMSST